ncbi:MAG: hypothetical protein DHS80DRAFT_22326 [Piptocephalis tieghemiana]|nr:MAG: hypothetical protein DHS80DRAFT_22326 [Piptocephalis tieghemiana]
MPAYHPSAAEDLAHRELAKCKVDYFSHAWSLAETHATQRLLWCRKDLLDASGYSKDAQTRCENLLWRLQFQLSYPLLLPRPHERWRNQFEKYNTPLVGPFHMGLEEEELFNLPKPPPPHTPRHPSSLDLSLHDIISPDHPASDHHSPPPLLLADPTVIVVPADAAAAAANPTSLTPDSISTASSSPFSSLPPSPSSPSSPSPPHHHPRGLTRHTRFLTRKPALKKPSSSSSIPLSLNKACRARLRLGHLDLGGQVSAKQFAQFSEEDPWASYLPLTPRSPPRPPPLSSQTSSRDPHPISLPPPLSHPCIPPPSPLPLARLTFCPTVEQRVIVEESCGEEEGSGSGGGGGGRSTLQISPAGWGMRMARPCKLKLGEDDEEDDYEDEDEEDEEEEDRPFYLYERSESLTSSGKMMGLSDYFGIYWQGSEETEDEDEGMDLSQLEDEDEEDQGEDRGEGGWYWQGGEKPLESITPLHPSSPLPSPPHPPPSTTTTTSSSSSSSSSHPDMGGIQAPGWVGWEVRPGEIRSASFKARSRITPSSSRRHPPSHLPHFSSSHYHYHSPPPPPPPALEDRVNDRSLPRSSPFYPRHVGVTEDSSDWETDGGLEDDSPSSSSSSFSSSGPCFSSYRRHRSRPSSSSSLSIKASEWVSPISWVSWFFYLLLASYDLVLWSMALRFTST